MLKIILRLSFALLIIFSGCNGQEQQAPSDVDLEAIPWVKSKAPLKVSLWNMDGKEITQSSQIKADTQYRLKVESEIPISMKLKVTDGFTAESCDKAINTLDTKRSYLIRTKADFSDKLYVNLVPLHEKDNGFVRERPQNFLLPEN